MELLGMKTVLKSTDMEQAELAIVASLKEQGFGILTEINVSATFKKKLDVDFRPYKILGACNPNLAFQALNIAEDVGLLLPCNVVLQQKGDDVEISAMNPMQMSNIIPDQRMKSLMEDAKNRLQNALNSLHQ